MPIAGAVPDRSDSGRHERKRLRGPSATAFPTPRTMMPSRFPARGLRKVKSAQAVLKRMSSQVFIY
jgi:hypothetical protein